MSENTSVATPSSTGIVSKMRRTRKLNILVNHNAALHEPETVHQLRQPLPRQSKLRGSDRSTTAISGKSCADEAFLEQPPGIVQTVALRPKTMAELRRERRGRDESPFGWADSEGGEDVLGLWLVAGSARVRRPGEW